MNYKDYYKIMGVEKNANQDAIKKAYRKLARKYHPDVSKEKDAESRFKDINEAYETIARWRRNVFHLPGSSAGKKFV